MNEIFLMGVRDAFEKHAAFGKAPVDGAVKTIAGVTKVFRGGKWVNPQKPPTLQSVWGKLKQSVEPQKANQDILAMARRYKTRGTGIAYA